MNKDSKYLQFPLPLLRGIFQKRWDVMDKIIDFGIHQYAKLVNVCENQGNYPDVSRQLMYDFYRNDKNLSRFLAERIDKYIRNEELQIDEEYNGFKPFEGFDVSMETDCLTEIFRRDREFLNAAIQYYKIHTSMKTLGITGNTGTIAKSEIASSYKGVPMPMVRKDLAFEFRDKEKNEFEIAQFAAYIGIRSILGKKAHCKTNKQHIFARMFGYSTFKQIPAVCDPDIKLLMKKYALRYWMDKIIESLELGWGVVTYSYGMRGIYIGLKGKVTVESLALVAEEKKKSRKIELLKQQKKQARSIAIQQINQEWQRYKT